MEYKDIKTADELESWYADKQAILDRHARDYMVPFGFVYHLDCSGYVSFERWNDTLPTAEEQTAFQAIQNGVSTKEIIEHKDEFGWTDRACRDAEEYDLAPCFIVPARKEYMQEQEIMNVRELYPELIGPDGEIIWSDPDFAKQGNEEAAGPDNFPGHELNDHKTPISPGSPSFLSRCTGRTIHPSSSRQISASRTPAVLPSTNRSHSPATTKTSSWT